MKLPNGKSKIVGLQAGEISINFINPSKPPLYAKIAHLDSTGNILGFLELSGGWSENFIEKVQAFADSLEEEIQTMLFEQLESTNKQDDSDPPQL